MARMGKTKTILRNTHKQSNINLLKVRDLYFDKARVLNTLKILIACLPSLLLILSYLPIFDKESWVVVQRDMYIGIISIAVFLISYFALGSSITKYLTVSNAFREEYDCNVLGLPINPFFCHGDLTKKHLDKAKLVKQLPKYEVWYTEVFCDNHLRNVICCQIDNILYTFLAYKLCRGFLYGLTAALAAGVLAGAIFLKPYQFVLVVIAAFSIFQICIESLGRMSEIISANKKILEYDKSAQQEICDKLDSGDVTLLRMFQDVIAMNRERSIFIPKFIRKKYLKDGNVFYQQLDQYKDAYFDHDTLSIPSCAQDIEVFDPQDDTTITLDQAQSRLLEMLTAVCEAFDREGIRYALDGGSLIGAVRDDSAAKPSAKIRKTGGRFIFWDDDIDLAIHFEDAERAKEVIRKLSQFDVQDYASDLYYSPRLSNFRVRDKNSCVCEKDSCLYELYTARGLFLDMYVYAPILRTKGLDKIYRRLFVHPLYKRILKTENQYVKTKGTPKCQKVLDKFVKLKAKYLKRNAWYGKHATNGKYLAYTPNYIHDLKKAGPYIKADDLFGEQNFAEFEGRPLPIPTNSDSVLRAFYGEWYVSPFQSIEELKAEARKSGNERYWFSHHKFQVTVLKHLSKVLLYPSQE